MLRVFAVCLLVGGLIALWIWGASETKFSENLLLPGVLALIIGPILLRASGWRRWTLMLRVFAICLLVGGLMALKDLFLPGVLALIIGPILLRVSGWRRWTLGVAGLGLLLGGVLFTTGLEYGSSASPETKGLGTIFIGLPLCALGLLVLITGVVHAAMYRSKTSQLPGHCRRCGYNLTGNVSGRCPECGTEIDLASLRFDRRGTSG